MTVYDKHYHAYHSGDPKPTFVLDSHHQFLFNKGTIYKGFDNIIEVVSPPPAVSTFDQAQDNKQSSAMPERYSSLLGN
jgi:hypothetical protein